MKAKEMFLFVALMVLIAQISVFAQPSLILPLKLDQTYRITIGYGGVPASGYSYDPAHNGYEYYALDFGHPTYNLNPEIVATAEGDVTTSENSTKSYGNHIIITHANSYTTTYAHLKTRKVEKGTHVKQGQIIGIMGNTGASEGEHLHFVLKQGIYSVLPEPMSGLTNLHAGLVISPVGMFSDGWHAGVSDKFMESFNKNGGSAVVGNPFDNGKSPYVHYWPDNGNPDQPGSSNACLVQDYKMPEGYWLQLVMNAPQTEVFPVLNKILMFWHDNFGYRDYGPPMGNEFAMNYSYGLNGYPGEEMVVQKFCGKVLVRHTIIFRPELGIAEHIPICILSITNPAGKLAYEYFNNSWRRWPNSYTIVPTGEWLLDEGLHTFKFTEPNGQDILGCGFTVYTFEGNDQNADIDLPEEPPEPEPDPGPEPEPPGQPVQLVLEAEDMSATPGAGDVWGDYRIIWSNGEIWSNINFASANYKFKIIAKGDCAQNEWPLMEFRIDNQASGSMTIASSSWQEYVFDKYVSSGIHKIAVAFMNDYYLQPEDRNLYVDKIIIESTEIAEPPDPVPEPEPGTDMVILDEHFDNSLNSFEPEIHQNVNAAIIWRDDYLSTQGVAVIDVYTPGSYYDVQLKTHISIQAGSHYQLDFRAMANVDRSIQLELCQEYEPWTFYGFWQEMNIGSSWQNYSCEFIATHTDQNARLTFHAGGQDGSIYLDWVKVTRLAMAESFPKELVAIDDVIFFQNHPNPFNQITSIDFELPKNERVTLKIYDLIGREVASLLQDEMLEPGFHTIIWNASNLPTGMYLARLLVSGKSRIIRLALIK